MSAGGVSLLMGYYSTTPYKWLESLSIFVALGLATTIQSVCDLGKDR
jgi:magnesium-transporting ATPase (P-type)